MHDQTSAWTPAFQPPAPPRTDRMRLEPLGPEVLELDYAAIMGSRVRLRAELQWGGWPPDEFTLQDNRKDLEEHYAEYERREAYAYTVLDPAGERCVGCIYLTRRQDFARLAFWVTDDALEAGLEPHLIETVLGWFEAQWPLERVVLPLRSANTRGIALARSLGLTPVERELVPDYDCFMWSRPPA